MKGFPALYKILLPVVLILNACKPSSNEQGIPDYHRDLFIARVAKNKEVMEQGIIEPSRQKDFKGLSYFDPDSSYRLQARIEWIQKDKVVFATNTERAPVYYKFCRLNFRIADSAFSLTAYSEDPDGRTGLFIPFKDITNGYSTYGGGRYVEAPYKGQKEIFMLDFNMAFNPYCHYNHGYSCPVVPFENVLNIPIPAGEKKLYE